MGSTLTSNPLMKQAIVLVVWTIVAFSLGAFYFHTWQKEPWADLRIKSTHEFTFALAPQRPTYNASRCKIDYFKDVLLVLTFNHPYYKNIPILREMYGDVFGKTVTCGTKPKADQGGSVLPDLFVDTVTGFLGYQCLREAMSAFPGYAGYLYGNDDMIINWWALLPYNKSRIWTGIKGKVDFEQEVYKGIIKQGWYWWNTQYGISACKRFYEDFNALATKSAAQGSAKSGFDAQKAFATYLANGDGKPRCGVAWSDFVYVPGVYATQLIGISDIAYNAQLFLEIAVNNIIHSLESSATFESVDGLYLPDLGLDTSNKSFWSVYTKQRTFFHPFKMGYLYGNDDMIINWWALLPYNKSRIWTGIKGKVEFEQEVYKDIIKQGWYWWNTQYGISACKRFYEDFNKLATKSAAQGSAKSGFDAQKAFATYLANGDGKPRCGVAWSDFVYVPGVYATQLIGISDIAYNAQLFLEIAVNNIIHSLESSTTFESVDGLYLPDLGLDTSNKSFWSVYTKQRTFFHPFKMGTPDFDYAKLKHEVISVTRRLCKGDE